MSRTRKPRASLLVTLDGKGSKQRIVPFSFELRKSLHRYITEHSRKADSLLLASRNETPLQRRVMLRDVKRACQRLGFQPPELIDIFKAVSSGKDVYVLVFTYNSQDRRTLHLKPEHLQPFQLAVKKKYEELFASGTP